MMKFIASDLEAAKTKAKRALGDKMVVVSVRDLPSGDVEVSASDKPEKAKRGPLGMKRKEPRLAPEPPTGAPDATSARKEPPISVPTSRGARLNDRVEQKFAEDALSQLSGSLTGGKKSGPVDLSDPHNSRLAEILTPHRLGNRLLKKLTDGARDAKIDDDLMMLEQGFRSAFTFAPLQLSAATPIMLVGPTGAGKTSASAKLAAAATYGDQRAFMITADVGRAGAIEQIQSYGETLGADYFVAETPLDVQQIMRSHQPQGAVILDTPGVSPYDRGDVVALASYRDACGAEPVLVLPASGDAEEYIDWARAFKEIGIRRMIITKFDATMRVGAALRAANAGGLALAHFSETVFISEGILDATPDYLARRFMAPEPGQMHPPKE